MSKFSRACRRVLGKLTKLFKRKPAKNEQPKDGISVEPAPVACVQVVPYRASTDPLPVTIIKKIVLIAPLAKLLDRHIEALLQITPPVSKPATMAPANMETATNAANMQLVVYRPPITFCPPTEPPSSEIPVSAIEVPSQATQKACDFQFDPLDDSFLASAFEALAMTIQEMQDYLLLLNDDFLATAFSALAACSDHALPSHDLGNTAEMTDIPPLSAVADETELVGSAIQLLHCDRLACVGFNKELPSLASFEDHNPFAVLLLLDDDLAYS